MPGVRRHAALLTLTVVACAAPLPAQEACREPHLSAPDSARQAVREAVQATLLTAARAAGVEDPRGLVVVMMDRDGGRPTFRLVDGNLPEAALALAAPHVGGLAAAWPGEGRIRFVVRLDPLPLPGCRAGAARRHTNPRFVRPDEGREVLCQLARRHAVDRVGLGQLVLWVALTRDGEVAYAEIEAGDGTLISEHTMVPRLDGIQMRPAALDGVPQDLLFSTQLLVRVRPEGRAPLRTSERVAGYNPSPLWDVSRDPSGCSGR